MNKHSFLILIACLAIITMSTSCSEEFSQEKIDARIGDLLTSINIQDATAVYYKGEGSRAGEESGFFKLDANGNESKLEFEDSKGKSHDIPIEYVVNASPRHMFFQPNTGQLFNAVLSPLNTDGFTDEDNQAIWKAVSITCIADKTTGKLYTIPCISLVNGTEGMEHNGVYYLSGEMNPEPTQIYAFNPDNLTVTGLLPDGQSFRSFSINTQGFVAYFGASDYAKVKCPGGGIKVLDERIVYTIGGTFYTPDMESGTICRWIPNGNNDLTKETVCQIPEGVNIYNHLYDRQKDICLFEAYYDTYKFNGDSFTALGIQLPNEFLAQGIQQSLFETKNAWYAKKTKNALYPQIDETKLLKLDKSDYASSIIDISNYQILEFVSNPNGSAISFTGIRYSDSKKVIGKINADNSIVIESAQSSNENIYNLIPLN